MHTHVSLLRRQYSSVLESILTTRPFNLLKNCQLKNIYALLIALCVVSGAAYGQSTAGQATVTFAIDDNNCSFSDPNGGGTYNSGTISVTINNNETESVMYQCLTAGAPYDYIQNLVNAINQHSPYVTASVISDGYFEPGGSFLITAKTTGSSTNYPLSVSATWNTNLLTTDPNTGNLVPVFTGPAYAPSAPAALSGGKDAPVQGFINPKYIITGVTYAPPGQQSNVTYADSTMVGNTTNLSSSYNDTRDYSISGTQGGLQADVTIGPWSIVSGTATVTGTASTEYVVETSDSSTITINKTKGLSDKTSGPADSFVGLDHDYDVIWLWLNPVLPMQADPNIPNSLIWNGYGFDPADQPEMDIFPVFVGWLNGDIPVPPDAAAVLARTWAASGQTFAAGDGPGLTGPGTGTDFETIGQADPFWQCTPHPESCPTTVDPARFTLTANSNLVYEQAAVGGQPISQTYTQSYSNTDAEASGTKTSFQQGFGLEEKFTTNLFILHLETDMKQSNKMTWTNSTLKTLTNQTQSTATATITGPTCTVPNGSNFCSPEYNGPPEFSVYEDNQYGTFMFFPVPTSRFRLAATPASQKVPVGSSTSFTVTSTAFDGFTGNVSLSVSGLPANATASFSSTPISGAGGSSTLTITTASSVAPGSYSLTITGTSGTITSHVPVTLVVQDFSLSATPGSATVNAPGTATYTVTASGLNSAGFNSSIALSVSGLPTGATASFSTSPLAGAGTSTLTVTVPASSAAGNYGLTISGTSGALSHSTQVNLTVTAPDFSISATPSTQTVTAGGNTTYTVSTSALNGFTGSVSLGTSGLPTGATASFSPSSISGSTTSTLTISTLSSTPAATYTITITGVSGSINHSTAVLLAVNAPTGSVTISAPANNSNQSTSVRVTASATETGTTVAQMQVWDNTTGVRLGINNGSTIDQTYTLAVGTHQIIVEDLAAGTFAVIHTSTVNITVFADGVHITAPASNASITGPVHVTGFATEAATQIAQMQVWDNTTGVRLGINNGSTIDQTYTLASGTHQIIMEDLAAGTFAVIHTASVTITVH